MHTLITPAGSDSLTASFENGRIVVKVKALTVDPTTDHVWIGACCRSSRDRSLSCLIIGLFRNGEAANNMWVRYKWVKDRFTDVSFGAPKQHGTYELRLFANKTYNVVCKSNSVEVPEKK